MKFLWQQVLAFLVVMLVALSISAYQVSNYMINKIYEDRESQLLNYGRNIIQNNFTRKDLERASLLLSSENIYIQVYLEDGRIIYPTYDTRYNSILTPEELQVVKEGKSLGLRSTQRLSDSGEVMQLSTVYLPVRYDDVGEFPAGFMSLSAPLDDLNEQVTSVEQNILVSFGIATIVGSLISMAYAIYQTRKIKSLQKATREVASGNYDIQVEVYSHDEIGDLADDFRMMTTHLVKSNEEIKRQEKLRRQFMMDAAHEMRTPLTTMSGLLEGLKFDLIPENQRERSLDLIFKETQRLIRLVNENLDYEKIRSRQITLTPQLISGMSFLEQIKQQLDGKASQKNDTIRIQATEDLRIYADYDRLMQIMINLVTNAIQFSENSEIILVGKMLENETELRVIDHGIGIDVEEIESIWERFYKVDVSRKNTQFGESGIGLAVVQSLVEAHDGTIQVESELGKGTTFIIHLPYKTNEEEN